MNLVLFDAGEVAADGSAALRAGDRRFHHLVDVVHVEVGRALRAGIVDGLMGEATVTSLAPDHIGLACRLDAPPPPARDVLVLAVGRPKVMRRCVETAAALGFARILLVRTWRTDRSHVQASTFAGPALRHHARLGLEQACRTRMPEIATFPLFRPFVEDELDALCGDATRLVADPDAPAGLAALGHLPDRAVALAIGPERGFTEFEVGLLAEHGFDVRHCGRHPLRVETALAFVFGQVELLRAAR